MTKLLNLKSEETFQKTILEHIVHIIIYFSMALTNAERQKEWREKQKKKENKEAFLEKE